MQNDLDTHNPLNERRSGIGGGTIAAVIAALLIVGALFTWGPWSGSHRVADNMAPGTTTGSTSTTGPAAPVTAPVTAPAPTATR
jgi:hypothetical protein